MAGKWSDFKAQYEQYLASLSPGARAALEAFTNGPTGANGKPSGAMGDIGTNQTHAANARAELIRAGLTGPEADDLLRVGTNIRQFGDASMDDPFLGGAEVSARFQGLLGKPAAAAAAAKEADSAATLAQGRQGITNQLQRYYDMLNAPVINPDGTTSDPLAKQLIASGANVAQGEAARRGVGGPLAGTAAMASAQSALQPYLAQRQVLAGQALSALSARDMGLEDQRLKADSLELDRTNMENDARSTAYNADQKQRQGIGSAIGTGVGALGFIGGPALGAATMAAGGALGGGIGGMTAGGAGPTLARPRLSNSSGRGSGKGNF